MFYVLSEEKTLKASCLKTIKKNKVVVGDNVTIKKDQYSDDKYIITSVLPRKNIIPRPSVANIDMLAIIIAPVPKPDLYLVDKLLIYCDNLKIEPILVINKMDLSSDEFIKDIHSQYPFLQIFEISTKLGTGITDFQKYISNSIVAVCGQSAVGKSSLINTLIPDAELETQGLSAKISRGKHTTRVNQIFVKNDIMIVDTPGFSSLDLEIDYNDLSKYYPEFEPYLDDCKYLDCSHIKEGNCCGVYNALGKINKDRYLRYVDLYSKLKEKWEKKYD